MLHPRTGERRPASGDPTDCLQCRLSGGVSLVALSGLLGWQRLTLPAGFSPATGLGLSAASFTLAVLGGARLLNLPPFRRDSKPCDVEAEEK